MKIQRNIRFEDELNPQQLQVVTAGSGPILVIAGAGSGKTRTLTYRVAYLLQSGIDPHKILLLTFTNKAAREMIHRVEALVPSDIQRIWGGTFHHVANRILRAHAQRLGYDPHYTILDQSDAQDLLDSCLQDLGHKRKESVIPQGAVLFKIISLAKNTRIGLEEILNQRYPFFLDFADEIESIADHYTAKKKEQNVLDFDDLLGMWLVLLEQDAGLRDYYTQRFEYILVDEYQDTNKLQADIIDLMASVKRNIMVVGDDSQSIYAFRGANFSNIMDFPKRYPDTQMYKLEHNYRSSPEILELANESIVYNDKQFPKVLRPIKTSGVQPHLVVPSNVFYQAKFVAGKIGEYISSGIPPEEIAVLYRAHFHSMELQIELNRSRISFEVRSGIRFFEQAHIKDIVSYMKIMLNPYDEIAWKRILQLMPGVGQKTSQKIFAALVKTGNPLEACCEHDHMLRIPKAAQTYWDSFCDMIRSLQQAGDEIAPAVLMKDVFENGYSNYMRSKYPDSPGRIDDVEQFIEFAWQYESTADFLSELALMTSTAEDEARDDTGYGKVKLSTVHQAKGLEWSVVFIIWLVEGRFPNAGNFESMDDEEEERRLFYVAVTRAKDHLHLCAPEWLKDSSGYATIARPSRFLRELPEQCYQRVDESPFYYEY